MEPIKILLEPRRRFGLNNILANWAHVAKSAVDIEDSGLQS